MSEHLADGPSGHSLDARKLAPGGNSLCAAGRNIADDPRFSKPGNTSYQWELWQHDPWK